MNLDPLQMMLYSNIILDKSKDPVNHMYIFVGIIFYILYQWQHTQHYYTVENYLKLFFTEMNNTVITIPYHKHILHTFSYGGRKETIKTEYSNQFHGLNYYLEKHHQDKLSKVTEIMTRDTHKHPLSEDKTDYIFLPTENSKILIVPDQQIYLELCITVDLKTDNKKEDTEKKMDTNNKNYTFKLSKVGTNNLDELKAFLKKCTLEYEEAIEKNNTHVIYEFVRSEKDDYDKYRLVYSEYTFKSNKFLDKNIFFPKKQQFIDYIDRFIPNTEYAVKHEAIYKTLGVTYKGGILLSGPPGTGKSSIGRGILNRTGRKGVLLRWSAFKTCSEFTEAFRSGKINGKKYELKDLCFFIEDFDANNDDILKKRDSKSKTQDREAMTIVVDNTDTDAVKSKQLLMSALSKDNSDELTLDFVLNVMDGLIELHNTMYVFTTNRVKTIDPAFLRPGRIDYLLELDNATVETIREMVQHKFTNIPNFDVYSQHFEKMKDLVISPADVQNVYMKYADDQVEDCLNELIEKTNPPEKIE